MRQSDELPSRYDGVEFGLEFSLHFLVEKEVEHAEAERVRGGFLQSS